MSTANPNPTPKNYAAPVPPAVKAAAEAAEALIKEQAKARNPEEPKAEEKPPEPTNPAPEPPKAQETAPPVPTNPNPPPAPPQDDMAARVAKLENDLRAEQGRVRTQLQENDNLRRLLAQMQAAPPAPPPPAQDRQLTFENLIKPEERQEYGDDFLDMVKRAAMEMAGGHIAKLENKVAELEGKVQGATTYVQTNAERSFWQELDAGVPNWRDINGSQEWREWLGGVDPFSGRTRNDLLNEAQDQKDARRVVAFLQGFQREAAVTAPPSPAQPPVNTTPKVPLETFAAPGRPSAGSAPANGTAADKRIISRAEVSQFFADKTAGRYKGREQEAAAKEAEIFQAGNEGRIQ